MYKNILNEYLDEKHLSVHKVISINAYKNCD